MPIFEYLCLDCGKCSEILVISSGERPQCPACGTRKLKKLLSVTSSLSGPAKQSLPGPGATACCGSKPGEGSCAGPGSCCGK